jgi:hypothetical protein
VEGTPFGRYQLIELLGRGGMGEVWRAHDTTIDRVVALKVLPHFAQVPEFDRRFRREARAAARLDDPHVVPIYDVGEIDGWLYVTMRLIAGQDLQTVLNDGPLPPARAVHIIEQIASALHGHYHLTRNFTNGSPQQDLLYSVATDCLRTDDRCMSYFHAPSDFRPLMFSDGTWVSELEFDGKCPTPGGPTHLKYTAEFPLPQPLQNPITKLIGNGHQEQTGKLRSQHGRHRTFTRTGD